MEKMYLIPSDKYNSMNHSSGKKVENLPDDVKIKLLNDEKMKKKAVEKLKKEKTLASLQPLLALQSANIADVLKKIPVDKQVQANFLLQMISRLPKLSIVRNRITIDGEPLREEADQIVEDMIDNGITNTKAIVKALSGIIPTQRQSRSTARGALPSTIKKKKRKKRTQRESDDDDEERFHTFNDEIRPLIEESEPWSREQFSPSLTSTPGRSFLPSHLRNASARQRFANSSSKGNTYTKKDSPQPNRATPMKNRLRQNIPGRSEQQNKNKQTASPKRIKRTSLPQPIRPGYISALMRKLNKSSQKGDGSGGGGGGRINWATFN